MTAVPPERELSDRAAIVGIGETDYGLDYRAARRQEPGYDAPTSQSLALIAFERALADAGLTRQDVDGLHVTLMEGGQPEEYAKLFDITPRHMANLSFCPFSVSEGAQALAAGKCDTIALLWSTASRSVRRVFGGSGTYGGSGRDSYYYYHPWRWSSQAAHWALMFRYYMETYGATEEDLGHVALTLRRSAMLNENSVMQNPLTMDEYLSSRYIVAPMHLLDMCLVNDGAVCVIMRRTEMAGDGPHLPVLVSGWGYDGYRQEKMRTMVKERLRYQLQEGVSQALAMAGMDLSEIGHLEVYDPSTIHLVNQIEGFGFVPDGEGVEFVKAGHIAIGGTLPTNTNGGQLSQSYMVGWSNLAESVKQLRHQAGPRQVEGLGASLFACTTTDATWPIIFKRGE